MKILHVFATALLISAGLIPVPVFKAPDARAADTRRPTAPTGLTAAFVSNAQISLIWNKSADNVGVVGYQVFRCRGTNCTPSTQIGTSATASYSDASLSSSTVYRYRVRAVDASNNRSAISNTLSQSTLSAGDAIPPSNPGSLGATVISAGQINLSWTASTDNVGVSRYQIDRCQGTGCADFSQIATSVGTNLSNTGLTGSTSYSYRVRAADAAGNLSGYSSAASATTATTATPKPTLVLTATPTHVIKGASSTLAWSTTNATTCVASGGWSGARPPSGSLATGTLTTTTSYALSCTGAGGEAAASTTVTVDASSGSVLYGTNFPNTENPISEGGVWINGDVAGLDWNNPQTVPGRAYASVRSGATGSRYDDSIAYVSPSYATFTPNQFAEATVYRVAGYSPTGSGHEVELLLRFQITAHNARGYEVLWGHSGYLAIVRWNGPLGSYTALLDTGDPGIGAPVDGDVLRAEIVGSVIKVYKNGVLVVTGPSDSTWTDGQPGIGFWPVDSATPQNLGWKNFSAGNM